jgi:hypothetical protein
MELIRRGIRPFPAKSKLGCFADNAKPSMVSRSARSYITLSHMGVDFWVSALTTSQAVGLPANTFATIVNVDMDLNTGVYT